jgi:L-rhamnose isomerase
MSQSLESRYQDARDRYQALGVDTETALARLADVSISIQCWQADDVGGFEHPEAALTSGGIQVTGHYPGRARNLDELRADLDQVRALVPGRHRLNLHAIYGDYSGQKADRDTIGPQHFASWMDWASERGMALDFNATLFSHPLAADGYTLSHSRSDVRAFWVEHVKRCREIAAQMGKRQHSPCVHNLWIPDGEKDLTVSRAVHRQWLLESLDVIFETTYDTNTLRDAVESKLFGIGSESFVVGSNEFYLAYALSRKLLLCLDMGHFHPTESVADKVSALLPFFPELLVHVSRPVRWDSDHVVIGTDSLFALMQEIVRADALGRVRLALDFFDGSINRIGAYVIGIRATQKALLQALLEPTSMLRDSERSGDRFSRLAWLDELKALQFADVWDRFCERENVAPGSEWIATVKTYEAEVLAKR